MEEYNLLMIGTKKALDEFVKNFKHPNADISHTIRKMPPEPGKQESIEYMLRMHIGVEAEHILELRGEYRGAWVRAQSFYPALKELGGVSLMELTAKEIGELERERMQNLSMPQPKITT